MKIPSPAPPTQGNEGDDWTKRLLKSMPFNPHGPEYGGQDFASGIFATPPNPAAGSLSFDKNAIGPQWLDPNGKLYERPGQPTGQRTLADVLRDMGR